MILRYLREYANSEKIAVYCEKEGLSYKQLWQRTEALAWFLKENYDTDKTVAIYGDKENEMLVCMYAAIKAGKIYVVLPSTYPEEHNKLIMKDCKPDVVLSPSAKTLVVDGVDVVDRNDIKVIVDKYADYPSIDCKINSDDTAFIIYTSGSSGTPKGVEVSFTNILFYLKHAKSIIAEISDELDGRYKETLLTSYAFIASMPFYAIIGYLGGIYYTIPTDTIRDTEKLVDYLKWAQPHGFVVTPSLICRLLESSDFNCDFLNSLKLIALGGEPLMPELAEKVLDRFPNTILKNAYSATEGTAAGVLCEITPELINCEKGFLPITKKDNSRCFIMDNNGEKITKDDELGEFVFYGDMIAKGYYNRSEMTKERFFELPGGIRAFRTGDMGFIKNGYIYMVGRKDNQVKIGGNRIEIEEVESRMKNCSIVKDCAVAVNEDSRGVKSLVAYVVLDSKEEENNRLSMFLKIKKEMMQNMEYYKIPQKIIFVDSIPKTNTGKTDRKKLAGTMNQK